jgi:hypothetical protein
VLRPRLGVRGAALWAAVTIPLVAALFAFGEHYHDQWASAFYAVGAFLVGYAPGGLLYEPTYAALRGRGAKAGVRLATGLTWVVMLGPLAAGFVFGGDLLPTAVAGTVLQLLAVVGLESIRRRIGTLPAGPASPRRQRVPRSRPD